MPLAPPSLRTASTWWTDVAAAVQPGLLRGPGRPPDAGAAGEAGRPGELGGGEADLREAVAQPEDGLEVAVDVEVAGDEGPGEAELTGRREDPRQGFGRPDDGRGRVRWAEPAPVVRVDRDREVTPEDLLDERRDRRLALLGWPSRRYPRSGMLGRPARPAAAAEEAVPCPTRTRSRSARTATPATSRSR
jgi:hypothetical protein